MTTLMPRVLGALDRFHAARPWDHNAHYHRWMLRQLPKRFGDALDVGCGSGELVRLLAVRAGSVQGLDADPTIIARARELTDPATPVNFLVGDAPEGMPRGPYDVITCVATLHHLPFTETLTRFRDCLTPGGTLVIVGVARSETPGDQLLATVSAVLNVAMALLKNRGRGAARPVAMTATVRPADMSFPDITRDAHRLLPGARLRRRLFWRYTLVWQKS
ncbi:class I SAM-dependent methyltransferase [Streptomyces uncialis]|uniref:class I SAM-dependent methyltransferase n=1 Tax=Streptomyces uncialis TaxID=1048205 RepID=UPI0038046A0C